jgi:hypothetical protein
MTFYRFSALAYGIARMWRGWAVILPVVVVNALLQALLIWPDPTPGLNVPAILLALASAVFFLAAYALVGATALHVPEGHVGWPQALGVVRQHAARYIVTALVLGIVAVIGLALYTVPGVVVIAVTPFVLLAALDGQRNPLVANFVTLGRRFWRWLVTIAITGLVVVVGWLLAGLFAFFIRGGLASFTAWALVYRSANASAG